MITNQLYVPKVATYANHHSNAITVGESMLATNRAGGIEVGSEIELYDAKGSRTIIRKVDQIEFYRVSNSGVNLYRLSLLPNWVRFGVKVETEQSKSDVVEFDTIQLSKESLDDYDTWVRSGKALHAAYGGSERGLLTWMNWCSKSEKFEGHHCKSAWVSFSDSKVVSEIDSRLHLLARQFSKLVAKSLHEAEQASKKYPQPNAVLLKIAEEAGEVVRGGVHYSEGRMKWSEVEGGIVQLLAMLIRFVTEGDQKNGIVPPPDFSDPKLRLTPLSRIGLHSTYGNLGEMKPPLMRFGYDTNSTAPSTDHFKINGFDLGKLNHRILDFLHYLCGEGRMLTGVYFTDVFTMNATFADINGHETTASVKCEHGFIPQSLYESRKYKLGDTLCKKSGSNWTGKVVGFYSTSLTQIGYAIESLTEKGSVQIYPESALKPLKEVCE